MVEGRPHAVGPKLRRLNKCDSSKRRTLDINQIEKNVNEVIASDLLGIAKALKRSSVSTLHLFQKHAELQKRNAENKKLGFLGDRHSETLYTFSKNLAWALSSGGCLQELELGFALWQRDLKIIAESICQSPTLKRLSFANSELGDHGLQILGKSLQECAQLEILNLSACGLTDAVSALLGAILKAHVCRRTQGDWQASLRSSKGVNALTMRPKGLIALDISLNCLSDFSVQTICSVLRIGTPLESLNLRGNQLTRISGKLLLDVMEEWTTLRLIDLRDNTDNKLMGVLEDRQHLTTFTKRHPPFWMASFSRLGRITHPKTSSKRTRTLNISLTGNASTRPQSCPNIIQSDPQPKRCVKPPLVLQQSTSRHIEHMKDNKHMQRPSTSPAKDNTSLSSCPSEFTAWRDNDSSTKENRMPFDTSWVNPNVVEEFARKQARYLNVKRTQDEEDDVLKPMDLRRNFDSGNYQAETCKTRQGSEPVLRKVNCDERQLRRNIYDESCDLDQGFEQMDAKNHGRQTASLLKEMTRAILHLQKRLDELIGPAEADSLAEQAASQLQVLG